MGQKQQKTDLVLAATIASAIVVYARFEHGLTGLAVLCAGIVAACSIFRIKKGYWP